MCKYNPTTVLWLSNQWNRESRSRSQTNLCAPLLTISGRQQIFQIIRSEADRIICWLIRIIRPNINSKFCQKPRKWTYRKLPIQKCDLLITWTVLGSCTVVCRMGSLLNYPRLHKWNNRMQFRLSRVLSRICRRYSRQGLVAIIIVQLSRQWVPVCMRRISLWRIRLSCIRLWQLRLHPISESSKLLEPSTRQTVRTISQKLKKYMLNR